MVHAMFDIDQVVVKISGVLVGSKGKSSGNDDSKTGYKGKTDLGSSGTIT